MLLRRTKILATLGPATDKPGVLEDLFEAGIDVVRLNFSHGSAQDHIDRANRVRELSKKTGRRVGILADLQGPKIRIERFKENKVRLEEGQAFALDINLGKLDGDNTQVGISYEPLAREVKPGTRLLLDDGRVVLDVVNVENNTRVNTTVVVGGDLSNNKGINLLGGGLSAAALTDKDKEDIKTIAVIQADYVAISFPRTADDMHEARALLQAAGSYAGLVAKVERAEAMDVIDEIILASDAIMVARGDLGVEMPIHQVPLIQKDITHRCNLIGKPVITATQMLESMISSPDPTRAEATDVANSILDGTDAVMLSGETAVGDYPMAAVQTMHNIALQTEQAIKEGSKHTWNRESGLLSVTESVAQAVCRIAYETGAKAILCNTTSGSTARLISKYRPLTPIITLTSEPIAYHQLALSWGVQPLLIPPVYHAEEMFTNVVSTVVNQGLVEMGDKVVITSGVPIGMSGTTSLIKVHSIGQPITA